MAAGASVRNKDVLGGALVCALGAGAIAMVRGNAIGTLGRMGAGFFPTLIGVVLVLSGTAILLGGLRAGAAGPRMERPDLRAWTLIPLSLVAFVVVGEHGGLLPATFAVVFIAALADRDNTWRSALLLSGAMILICLVVFWWALRVQFPLITFGFEP